MPLKIHKETVTGLLWDVLITLMNMDCLSDFRLVGGTSLSLLIGHRKSIDIDMFTDIGYGDVDFIKILESLKSIFEYVESREWSNKAIGNSCYIGKSPHELVKLDLFHTDPFVYPMINYKSVRLSSHEEIVAMKLDVIGRGGRKKDFWDIHALMDKYSIDQMLDIYKKRYPYNFKREQLLKQLNNFLQADIEPDPICLRGKYWELIKFDLQDELKRLR